MIGLFKKSKKKEEVSLDLGLTDNTIKAKEQEIILKYLQSDEKIECALYAHWENLFDGKKNMLVLTDKRILAIKGGLFLDTSSGFTAIEYPNISSVTFEDPGKWGKPGKIGFDNILGKITITTTNVEFKVKVLKFFAKQASDIIIEHINNGKQNISGPSIYQNIDIADQIKKLADLKDQGIITEDEFISQKGKLLGM
ncbi:hypothetical protein Mpsy_0177 [Methanolobus psychrophilus R15]|nr:hypothetical protein Mpsy_0177 [Methanolobus psychrophilus R15]